MTQKILVCDDSPTELTNMEKIISDAGYTVVTAKTGAEAVGMAKAEKPGMIFMDIVMPDMDGYEACRLLGRDGDTKDIPVVFVTGKGQKADRVWAQMQGAKAYLTKPVTADQVVDELKALG